MTHVSSRLFLLNKSPYLCGRRCLGGIGDAHVEGDHNAEDGGGGDTSVDHDVLKAFAKNHPVKISFRYPLTSQTVLTWDTTLMRDNLYIGIPEGCLPDASKEAFVELLEFAEEKLHCQFAIVYFKKDRVDRAILIRTFMFLGFYIVPPDNELVPSGASDFMFMGYRIQ